MAIIAGMMVYLLCQCRCRCIDLDDWSLQQMHCFGRLEFAERYSLEISSVGTCAVKEEDLSLEAVTRFFGEVPPPWIGRISPPTGLSPKVGHTSLCMTHEQSFPVSTQRSSVRFQYRYWAFRTFTLTSRLPATQCWLREIRSFIKRQALSMI